MLVCTIGSYCSANMLQHVHHFFVSQIYGIDSDNRAIPVERNPVKIIYSTDACEEVCTLLLMSAYLQTWPVKPP